MAQIELGSRLIIGVVLFLLDPSRPILSTLIAIVLPRLVVVVAVVGGQNFAGNTPNKRRHSNGQEQRPTAQDFFVCGPASGDFWRGYVAPPSTTATDHNNNKMNAAEVCEVMERAPKDMSRVHVDFSFTTGEACCTLWHRVMDSRWETECRDPLDDVELWRRFGLAVCHSKFYILQSRMCSWLDEGLVEREGTRSAQQEHNVSMHSGRRPNTTTLYISRI